MCLIRVLLELEVVSTKGIYFILVPMNSLTYLLFSLRVLVLFKFLEDTAWDHFFCLSASYRFYSPCTVIIEVFQYSRFFNPGSSLLLSLN